MQFEPMTKSTLNMLTAADKTVVGNTVCLVPLDRAAKFFPGYGKATLSRLLRLLKVPIFYDKTGARFNLYALEEVLHYLLRPSGPGFAAPGSKFKGHQMHHDNDRHCVKVEVSIQDLEAMSSPEVQRSRKSTGLNAMSISQKRRQGQKCREEKRGPEAPVVAGTS